MLNNGCSIDGKKYFARGWCQSHYTNWWKYGNPLTYRRSSLQQIIVCYTCKTPLTKDNWAQATKRAGNFMCKSCRRQISREYQSRKRKEQRAQLIEAYGSKCNCCGEQEKAFLVIDHVNGGGNKERAILKYPNNFYPHIIKQGFPPSLIM